MSHYEAIETLIKSISNAKSIIDIDCKASSFATCGNFKKRFAISKEPLDLPNVSLVDEEWLNYDCEIFDVIVCSEVLENFDQEKREAYINKMFEKGRNVIISMACNCTGEACKNNKLGHVNEHVFRKMVGIEWKSFEIIDDKIVSIF